MAEVVLTSTTPTLVLVHRDSLEDLVKTVSLSMAQAKQARRVSSHFLMSFLEANAHMSCCRNDRKTVCFTRFATLGLVVLLDHIDLDSFIAFMYVSVLFSVSACLSIARNV